MITRKEFNEMSFEDAWEYCCGESDYFKDRDSLSECCICSFEFNRHHK